MSFLELQTRKLAMVALLAPLAFGCRDGSPLAPESHLGDPRRTFNASLGDNVDGATWWGAWWNTARGLDEPGTIQGIVELTERASDDGAREVSLSYTIYRAVSCDTVGDEVACEWETVESGSGRIPSQDFVLSGTDRLVLATNTGVAANPDFDRATGVGGEVTLEWRDLRDGWVEVVGTVVGFAVTDRESGSLAAAWRVASVTVTPSSAAARVGDTVRFTATAKNSAGYVLSGAPVVWASSDTTVAGIDVAGVATARCRGSAMLTAASDGQRGAAVLTVTGPRRQRSSRCRA